MNSRDTVNDFIQLKDNWSYSVYVQLKWWALDGDYISGPRAGATWNTHGLHLQRRNLGREMYVTCNRQTSALKSSHLKVEQR